MSQRKIVRVAVSGSGDGTAKINGMFLSNLFGDTRDEILGKLELGPTFLDITNGLKHITQENGVDNDTVSIKYTIMLYISRGAVNNAVQFLHIESLLSKKEIINIFFEHLNYKLPHGKRLNKRKIDGVFKQRKYFGADEDFVWLSIAADHAYIYIGDYDGEDYKNNYSSAIDFIYRNNPENKPTLCVIM